MPAFTPPTVRQALAGDSFWGRWSIPVGQSVVKVDGHYTTTPFPWLGEIADLDHGTDYFLGGHIYQVTDEVAAALEADGFEIDYTLGFDEGEFNDEEYGE